MNTHRIFEINPLSVSFDFFRVVKPLHLDHHVPVPGLPEHLHLADVGPVDAGRRQEDGAVAHVEDIGAALNGSVEELLGLAFASRPSVAVVVPVPQRSSGHWVDPVDVGLLWCTNL